MNRGKRIRERLKGRPFLPVILALFCIGAALGKAAPVPAQTLTLQPNSSENPTGTSHQLTATLLDDAGSPIVGATVWFYITSGPNKPTEGPIGSDVTNQDGMAFVEYISNTAGRDNILARYYQPNTTVTIESNTATKDWGPGEFLSISQNNDINPAGSVHTFTAQVNDTSYYPITCEILSGPNQGWTQSQTSSTNGTADFSYTSNGSPGTDTIRCNYSDPYGTYYLSNVLQKRWVYAEDITLTPATATNRVGTQHTVTVEIVDESGAPVVDRVVSFQIVSGPNTGVNGQGTTDSQGHATFSYTGSGGEGTDRIQASFTNSIGAVQTSNEVLKVWHYGEGLDVTPTTDTNLVGDAHQVQATVTDEVGSPVVERLVNFQVISGPNAGTSGTDYTNGQGVAIFQYTGSGGAGRDQIRVSFTDPFDNEISSVVSKRWVYAEDITLSPTTAHNRVGEDHSVTARLTNSTGAPLADHPVTFEIISGPNRGVSETVTTDFSGRAVFTYTGTGGPGRDTIRATFINGFEAIQASDPVTKDWLYGESISLSQETSINLVGTQHSVTAEVIRDDGTPVAGRQVVFQITDGPNAGASQAVVTDSNGHAVFVYEGTGGVGTDIITASFVDELDEEQVSTPLQKDWFYAESVRLEPSEAVNVVGTEHMVTSFVVNEVADPVSGKTMEFTVLSGPNQGITGQVVTATDGTAVFTYTGSGGVGTDVIQASFSDPVGHTVTTTATKQWVMPERITLLPESAANQVGSDHTVTATVLVDDGTPVAGRQVTFEVISGPNAGRTGQATTDSQGIARFTYTGSLAEGTDIIRAAFVDTAGRPITSDPVSKTWVIPISFAMDLPSAFLTNPRVYAYRMVTFPVMPIGESDLFMILSPFFGQADSFQWRLFRPEGAFPDPESARYEEITGPGLETADYGKGYWIISMDATTVDVTGIPLRAADSSVHLARGYNMVGCPYADVVVSWRDVLDDPANQGLGLGEDLYFWDGSGEYIVSPTMDPGNAYWVWAENEGELHLRSSYSSLSPLSVDRQILSSESQPPPPIGPGTFVHVISPNGGERLRPGTWVSIQWEASGISPGNHQGTVHLWYSTDQGKSYDLIASYLPNTGSYRWRVPALSTKTCVVAVSSSDYPNIYDTSDSTFAIGW